MNNEYISPTKRNELNKAFADWILDESIEFTKNYNEINNPLDYINNNSYFLTENFDFRRMAAERRHSEKKLDDENSIYNSSQFYLSRNTGKFLLDNYGGIYNKLNRITNNVRSYNNYNNVMFHAAFVDVAGTRYKQNIISHFDPHLHVFILCPPNMKVSLEEAINQLNQNMSFKQNYYLNKLHLEKIENTREDNDNVRSYMSKYTSINIARMKTEEDMRFYPLQ